VSKSERSGSLRLKQMPSNSAAHLRPGSPGGLRSRVRGSTYCRAIRQRAVDVAQLEVRPVLHPVHPSRVHELVRGEAHRRQDPLGGGQLRRMFDLHQGHVTLPHHRVEVDVNLSVSFQDASHDNATTETDPVGKKREVSFCMIANVVSIEGCYPIGESTE